MYENFSFHAAGGIYHHLGELLIVNQLITITMIFYSKESKVIGYVVYSPYGLQSHIVMNQYGVVFAVNPILNEKGEAKVFKEPGDANDAQTTIYSNSTPIVFTAKVEKY
jgi:hypothetical protein